MFISDYKRVNTLVEVLDRLAQRIGYDRIADVEPDERMTSVERCVRVFLESESAESVEDVLAGKTGRDMRLGSGSSQDGGAIASLFVFLPDGIACSSVAAEHPELRVIRSFHYGYGFAYADDRLVDMHRAVGDADLTALDLANIVNMLKFSQYGDYVLFRYDTIPMQSNPLRSVQGFGEDYWQMYDGLMTECRSTVVDVRSNEIVSLPYHKFRNLDECDGYTYDEVSRIVADAGTVEFTEKLDGSMSQLRCVSHDADGYGFVLSSSGSLGFVRTDTDFGSRVLANRRDASDHVLLGFDALDEGILRMAAENDEYTFVFELIDLKNDPHVVSYSDDMNGMWLTGVRRVSDGALLDHKGVASLAERYGVRVTPSFDGYDLDKVIDVAKTAQTHEHEGFVMYADGFLVKLKLESYLEIRAVMQIASSFNYIIRHVYDGSMDDIVANVPADLRPSIESVADCIVDVDNRYRSVVERLASLVPDVDRKHQAEWLRERLPKSAFATVMNMLNGKVPKSFVVRYLDTAQPSYPNKDEFDRIAEHVASLESLADKLSE